jgi:hypothetical protein
MFIQHPLFRLFLVISVIIGIILIVPLRIPFSVTSHGKVYHGKEWIVSKDEAGRISATLYDRVNGRTDNYRLHQFERQDAVRFELHDSVVPGNFIHAGDTVGKIYSAQLDREIVSLMGDLAITHATIDLHLTGEKDAVIEEARNRLAYAEQQLAGYSVLLERQKELHRRKLISDEELDIALQQNRLYEIDILIAESQLQSALTGAKDEQIRYLNTRITTLEDEIRSLEKTIGEYLFLAPIDGIVYHTFSQDTLALIGDPSSFVAVIPVPLHYRPYVLPDQKVKLRIPGNNISTRHATVRSIGNTVRVMNGRQYFMINALVENEGGNDEYLPGIFTSVTIATDPVTVREYLMRYLRPVFN